VTIIKIDEEVDHGDVISSFQLPVSEEDTYKTLESRLAKLGAELMIKTLPDYLAGKIAPQPQDHSQATFTKKFTREEAKIDWSKTAEEIDRQIRALNPEPGTWTTWGGKTLKILEAKIQPPSANRHDRGDLQKAGQVFQENGKVIVKTSEGAIILKTVQLEGKKAMSIEDFIRGNWDFIGSVLE
jgi:methionyl-tRNA formyltransferase